MRSLLVVLFLFCMFSAWPADACSEDLTRGFHEQICFEQISTDAPEVRFRLLAARFDEQEREVWEAEVLEILSDPYDLLGEGDDIQLSPFGAAGLGQEFVATLMNGNPYLTYNARVLETVEEDELGEPILGFYDNLSGKILLYEDYKTLPRTDANACSAALTDLGIPPTERPENSCGPFGCASASTLPFWPLLATLFWRRKQKRSF